MLIEAYLENCYCWGIHLEEGERVIGGWEKLYDKWMQKLYLWKT
jgi:hypothetical protein